MIDKEKDRIIQYVIGEMRWAFRNIEETSLIKRKMTSKAFMILIAPILDFKEGFSNTVIENLSSKFHEIYQIEAKRQGDVRHSDKYQDLSENIKEFDRVLARYVLKHFKPI